MRFSVVLSAILGFLVCSLAPAADETRRTAMADEISRITGGTWIMHEWHREGKVFTRDNAYGLFMQHDGVIAFTVYRRENGATHTRFGNGVYSIRDGIWAYRYDHNNFIVTKGKAHDELLEHSFFSWGDYREFNAYFEGDTFTLETPDRQWRSVYRGDENRSYHNGELVRVWRRPDSSFSTVEN